MSDALPIRSHPDLDQYKELAEDLQRACRSADPAAMGAWAVGWLEMLARLDGADPTALERRAAIAHEAGRIRERWRAFIDDGGRHASCLLADAQLFVAREHGFNSWPTFASHIDALKRPESAVSTFEAAVDAIVAGDAATLRRLLRERPELVQARSTRDHQSTLLHYVSANGVEDFRQITPSNIVEITRILLEAGADVNATSEAYGGGSTALGLVATSIHPSAAGVQIPLLELLLARGAQMEQPGLTGNGHSIVLGCLANGEGAAARFFANRGDSMNLLEAAGVGRLDLVKTYFDGDGNLKSSGTEEQMEAGFLYACGYGAAEVAEFLLDRGVDPGTHNDRGQTGLHWAMYGPHVNVVTLLLRHGAPVNARDATESTAVHWALRGWALTTDAREREEYYHVVRLLIDAGAAVDLSRLEREHGRRRHVIEKVRSDSRMLELLRLSSGGGGTTG